MTRKLTVNQIDQAFNAAARLLDLKIISGQEYEHICAAIRAMEEVQS